MYDPLLDTFLVVAECGSFHQAAERLYRTPASVMNQINALEKRLGVQLFSRSRRGLALTAAGEVIRRDARTFIREAAGSVERARAAQEAADKTIRVGSSFLNPCHVFLDLWNRKAENPTAYNFKIIPYSDDRTQILSVIRQLGEEMDLLVGAFNSAQMHRLAHYRRLGTYRLCVAMAADHPLAQKDRLEIADLYGQHLLIPTQETSTGLLAFFEAHPEIEVEQASYFYDLDTFNFCEQNHCLLLTLDAWAEVHPSLKTLPVNWEQEVPYGILYAKRQSAKMTGFLEQLAGVLSSQT